ncbi:MAG TPA: monovalent cation/H+ antiporter complex subunit F [Gaiellaceae bacterium]|nr:monovalent cation/H+ antiporter complex subunit F [Gaiellaceae bacterium]
MNAFTIAALALLAGYVPLGIVVLRAREIDALVALEACGVIATLCLMCLGEGFHRGVYFDVPVIAAATTWIGGLVFARFLGRYL